MYQNIKTADEILDFTIVDTFVALTDLFCTMAGKLSARITARLASDSFPNKWIGPGGPQLWPARSPDLTQVNFFCRGGRKKKDSLPIKANNTP